MAKDDNPFFDLAGSEIRSIPQSELEKFIGSFGKRTESLGKAMAEPLSETKKVAPIKSFLAQMLLTDPLQNAGTALQDWSHTPRETTPERPYTPSPFYGGSPATLNPNTWGPALQTFRTDPRAVDVAGLAQPAGALARIATTKVAAPVARAAGEAMTQRMLSGESLIPGLPQAVAPNPLMFAVKPKGGNWAPSFSGKQDSVLRALRPLKRHPQGVESVAVNRAAGENLWSKIVEGGGQYNPAGWLEMHRPDVYNALLSPEDAALNRWLEKKLTPYVRNEMGTPDDPVRLAHEQGYTHSPSISNIEAEMGGSWLPERTAENRLIAGFPDEGFAVTRHAEAGYPEGNLINARKAEEWENRSDSAIDPNIAEVYQEDIKTARDSSAPSGPWNPTLEMANNNPWIEKLDPNTPIYKIADEQTFSSDLDFNHLMDELRNAVRPESDLPDNLRLTPKQLEKVTVDQAVKRVSDINDWRMKQKSAVLKDNAATFTHKEYPDTGYKWVELKLPESVEDGTKSLEEALKHEGNVMGHCVGGYCPDVASGQSRIYSLRDPEGKAHVTIEVQPTLQTVEGGKFSDIWDEVINRVSDEEYGALQNKHPDDDLYDAFRSMHGRYVDDSNEAIESMLREFSSEKADQFLAELENVKPTIVQIRGKGNAKPISDYAPYVQDFVRSGEWDAVNEIENAHLINVQDYNSVQDALKEISGAKSKSKIPKEYEDKFNAAYEANPKTDQFMTPDQFREFIGIPKPEGYAEGGAVHMQAGGLAKLPSLARRLFKPSALVSPHVEQMARAIASPTSRTFSDEEIKALLDASIVSRRKIPNELVNHGTLKTVFDTNKTGAANAKISKMKRGVREPELFAGSQGQTYASLVEDPTVVVPENIWSSYGDYGLEFKPEIKSRTTISIGDLSNYGGLPQTARLSSLINDEEFPALRDLAIAYLDAHPKIKNSRRVLDPKFSDRFGIDDQGFWDWAGLTPIKNEYELPFAGVRKVPRDLTDLSKLPLSPREQKLLESDPISEILKLNVRNNDPTRSNNNLDFIEAQIHGPVTTEDIARVYDYGRESSLKTEKQFKKLGIDYVPVESQDYAEGGSVKSDFFIDPSSYAQSRSKQMFPKQKSEWTQQDAARHMLASGMMAQKFGPTVAKIAGLAHEHGNAPVKTIGYMLGIGKMPPDYDQDLHNNALGVQIGKEAKSQEDLESRIQAILNSATKQPTPGQPWIGRPNIPNQISDYARGGKVSTNPFDHLV